jgi:hypothetical protein
MPHAERRLSAAEAVERKQRTGKQEKHAHGENSSLSAQESSQELRLVRRTTGRMTSLVRDMFRGKRSTGETHDAFRKLVEDTAAKIVKLRKENQGWPWPSWQCS